MKDLLGKTLKVNENDSNELQKHLPALRSVASAINFPAVVAYLNEKDVEYAGWNDLEMIIKYIEMTGGSQ